MNPVASKTVKKTHYVKHPAKSRQMKRLLEENARTNQIAKDAGLKNEWIYKSGIIVERPQVITPLPEEWFKKYEEWKIRWNVPILAQLPPVVTLDEELDEKKQRLEDLAAKTKAKEKALKEETEEEKKERLAAEAREARLQEIRDAHVKVEVKKVRSRETDADKNDDKKSVYRCLDKKLFLIVKKNRDQHAWQFPQGVREKGETMRQTAEREFKEECNVKNTLDLHFAGNSPLAHFAYPFEANVQKKLQTYGAKVFYYYSFYLDGEVSIDQKEIVDYLWVTKDEMKNYLDPALYKLACNMLPADGFHEKLAIQHYTGTPTRD